MDDLLNGSTSNSKNSDKKGDGNDEGSAIIQFHRIESEEEEQEEDDDDKDMESELDDDDEED